MAVIIHCIGTGEAARFRLWTTNEDRYLTPPYTATEMYDAAIMYDAWRAADRVVWTAAQDAAQSIRLAELHGSSEQGGRRRRNFWEKEVNNGEQHALLQDAPGLAVVDGKITVGSLPPLTVEEAVFLAAKIIQLAATLSAEDKKR